MDSQSSNWFLHAIIGTLACAAAVVLIMFLSDYGPDDGYRLEATRLLLQFLLIGVGGTLVLAYLNQRRSEIEAAAARQAAQEKQAADERAAARDRAAARRSALQELIIQLGDAYRRLKVVKRQLRAAILRTDPEAETAPCPPYSVPAATFEQAMEALLNAQIAAEEVSDRIGMSCHLLDSEQIGRICASLGYGARYFHDVYEDYEHCRVRRKQDEFMITPACRNLANFLFARRMPEDLPAGYAAEFEEQLVLIKDRGAALERRHAALTKIGDLRRQDPRGRRYRAVATECFSLAAEELRRALWDRV